MEKIFCKKCGKEIEDDSTFCKYCGSELNYDINSDKLTLNVNKKITLMEKMKKNKKILTISCIVLSLCVIASIYAITTISSNNNNGDMLNDYSNNSSPEEQYSEYYIPAKYAIDSLKNSMKNPNSLSILGMYCDLSTGSEILMIYYSGTNSFGATIASHCSFDVSAFELKQDTSDQVLFESIALIMKGSPVNSKSGDYFMYDPDILNSYI